MPDFQVRVSKNLYFDPTDTVRQKLKTTIAVKNISGSTITSGSFGFSLVANKNSNETSLSITPTITSENTLGGFTNPTAKVTGSWTASSDLSSLANNEEFTIDFEIYATYYDAVTFVFTATESGGDSVNQRYFLADYQRQNKLN